MSIYDATDNFINTKSDGNPLTLIVAKTPVFLVASHIQKYLNAPAEEVVTAFLQNGTERLDKGLPLLIAYTLNNADKSEVLSIEVEFSFHEDFSVIEHKQSFQATEERELPVYNLRTGAKYYFRVTLSLSDGRKVSKVGEVETAASPRMINLEGASNVRDIGGWQTASGKRIKQGLLYRGGEIDGGRNTGHPDFRLTEQGLAQLRALGIKTDFDLRSEENKVSENSILGGDVHREFYDAAQYQYVLDTENAEKTRKIFSDLAKKEAYPIYLHCSHGVDRAGTTVFLLEALLGVAKEDLIRDYEISAFYHNYKPVQRCFENGGKLMTLIEGLEKYDGETFLEKVVNFMLSIGVTAEEIQTLRSIFLENEV